MLPNYLTTPCLGALVITLLLSWPKPTFAGETQLVLPYLRGYEWQVDHDAILALGEEAKSALMAIVEDREQPNYMRARALESLSAFTSDEIYDFFVTQIRGETDKVSRRQLVTLLCETFAGDRPTATEDLVSPLLADSDPNTRIRSARCLRRIPTASSASKLKRYMATVTNEWEHTAIMKGPN